MLTHHYLVEASLPQEKHEGSVLKGSRLLVVLPTLGSHWDCEGSCDGGFVMSREGTDSDHVLESLVAHRLIDPSHALNAHTDGGVSAQALELVQL